MAFDQQIRGNKCIARLVFQMVDGRFKLPNFHRCDRDVCSEDYGERDNRAGKGEMLWSLEIIRDGEKCIISGGIPPIRGSG
jgi:hypothetical protein